MSSHRRNLCGTWSSLAPMLIARENFAADSGPDKDATGTLQVNDDPRVYAVGGLDENGDFISECEKYNPNDNTWTPIASLPIPLGNCDGVFVPDYGKSEAQTLGYIYVTGGNIPQIFRYNIRQDLWETFDLPFAVSNASLAYLDDIGGPIPQLLSSIFGINIPACTDTQTIWIVGGDGTEQQTYYIESNILGELVGDWIRGPDLPLNRSRPLVGRVFWRDAGITSFGVSNCASIAVCGGIDNDVEQEGKSTRDVQLLVRKDCDWAWITRKNNPTEIPDDILTLLFPVSQGAFGTEQWPETLVTGGRATLFGGEPPARSSEDKKCKRTNRKYKKEEQDAGTTQFGQFRFIEDRFQRDPELSKDSRRSAWNKSTSMPNRRINFKAAPLSQVNSSRFGGRRVSRFLCTGGRDESGVLNRSQLFELPVPSPFIIL